MKKIMISIIFSFLCFGTVMAAGEYNVLTYPGVSNDGTVCTEAMNNLIADLRADSLPSRDLYFPAGIYRFSIDISGSSLASIWNCQSGVLFLPESNKEYIITCDNTTNNDIGTGLEIQNATFNAKYNTWNPDNVKPASYCIQLVNTSGIILRNCNLTYGGVAAFYGRFAQYCKFYDCQFDACVYTNSSTGCILTGPNTDSRSNEVEFFRCRFMSNKNGLYIGGGEKVRVNDCTFQDMHENGEYAVKIDADLVGNGSRACHLSGCYFELNKKLDIFIGISHSTTIEKCEITNGTFSKEFSIKSTFTDNLNILNNNFLCSGNVQLNHPDAAWAGCASLSYTGNNIAPQIDGLTHANSNRPASITIDLPAHKLIQNENKFTQPGLISGSAFESDLSGHPLTGTQFEGFKKDILNGQKTLLFSINQTILTNQFLKQYNWFVFDITLSATNDESDANFFGHSQRIDKYFVSINNYQNILRSKEVWASGVDLGSLLPYTAIGQLILTTEVTTDGWVDFYVQFNGAGTAPSVTSRITTGYKVTVQGSNTFVFSRTGH